MEEDTPKFCETKETNINLQSAFSFSVVYEKKILNRTIIQHITVLTNQKRDIRSQNLKLNQNSKNWRNPVKIELSVNLINTI